MTRTFAAARALAGGMTLAGMIYAFLVVMFCL